MRHTPSRSRRQSGRRRTSRHVQHQRPRVKQRAPGIWAVLILLVLIIGWWLLKAFPPVLLVLGSIVGIVAVLVLMGAWLMFRLRFSPEGRAQRREQKLAFVQMQATAQALGIQPLELDDLQHLRHDEFEDVVGVLLETAEIAFDLKRVGGAGDRGVDLLGKDAFNRPFIVQCKHYFGHKVTPKEVREFRGARQSHHADIAWFVTTSTFTKQAEQEASDLRLHGLVVLVDGKKLMQLLQSQWEVLPHRWQRRLTECMIARDRQNRQREVE